MHIYAVLIYHWKKKRATCPTRLGAALRVNSETIREDPFHQQTKPGRRGAAEERNAKQLLTGGHVVDFTRTAAEPVEPKAPAMLVTTT